MGTSIDAERTAWRASRASVGLRGRGSSCSTSSSPAWPSCWPTSCATRALIARAGHHALARVRVAFALTRFFRHRRSPHGETASARQRAQPKRSASRATALPAGARLAERLKVTTTAQPEKQAEEFLVELKVTSGRAYKARAHCLQYSMVFSASTKAGPVAPAILNETPLAMR